MVSKVPRGYVTPLVTELRDLFPTFLDIAGIPLAPGRRMDGSSLACLFLIDPSGKKCGTQGSGWREYIDLEHDIIYNTSVHWNALTDGSIKYIFHANNGIEELFNLTADPVENTDLAQDPAYVTVKETWRARLVAQFESEGRGIQWVQNGNLLPREEGLLYSPHYPNSTQSTAMLSSAR